MEDRLRHVRLDLRGDAVVPGVLEPERPEQAEREQRERNERDERAEADRGRVDKEAVLAELGGELADDTSARGFGRPTASHA